MVQHRDAWESFKKAAQGQPDLQVGVQAVEAALARLRRTYEADLHSVILFGSFARASQDYDDIDLLVVTRRSWGSMDKVIRRLARDIFGPLFLEYGQLFSYLVYTQGQIQQLEGYLPLLAEIRKDGVLLYGQDLFAETTG